MGDVVFASNEIYFCHKQQMEANKMNQQIIGKFISHKRKEKNLTQEQLAEKLDVSTTFIGQIERAKGIPSLETLVKIANVLETSTDSLLFGDLNTKSGNNHFATKVAELTENFTSNEKELVLKNIEIKVVSGKKVVYKDFGEMLFTHFGVSGPTILSSSSHLLRYKDIDRLLKEEKIDKLSIMKKTI